VDGDGDPDEDGDGLLDIVETDTGVLVSLTDTGSDPFLTDTDGDGADDLWEALNSTNPSDPNDIPSNYVPALGPFGQGLLLLALAAAAVVRLRPRPIGSQHP
jgi:hypothetical protein